MKDLRQDGGIQIFALFDSRCKEKFRVIYNGGPLHGTGVRPQGVITAYAVSGNVATMSTPSLMKASYRTN